MLKKRELISKSNEVIVWLRAWDDKQYKIFEKKGVAYIDYERNIFSIPHRIEVDMGNKKMFVSVVCIQNERGDDLMIWTPMIWHDGYFGVGPFTGPFKTELQN